MKVIVRAKSDSDDFIRDADLVDAFIQELDEAIQDHGGSQYADFFRNVRTWVKERRMFSTKQQWAVKRAVDKMESISSVNYPDDLWNEDKHY